MDQVTSGLCNSLQALIATAESEAALPGTANDAQAAALELAAQCQAIIAVLTLTATAVPVRNVTVGTGTRATQTIFQIAQQQLGDPLRFADVRTMNGLKFIALNPGEVLSLPAS